MCETYNPQQLGTYEVHVLIQIQGPQQPRGPQLEGLLPTAMTMVPEYSCSPFLRLTALVGIE